MNQAELEDLLCALDENRQARLRLRTAAVACGKGLCGRPAAADSVDVRLVLGGD